MPNVSTLYSFCFVTKLGDAEKGDEMQTNMKVDDFEDENAIMIDDQLQKDQEATDPLGSQDVKVNSLTYSNVNRRMLNFQLRVNLVLLSNFFKLL